MIYNVLFFSIQSCNFNQKHIAPILVKYDKLDQYVILPWYFEEENSELRSDWYIRDNKDIKELLDLLNHEPIHKYNTILESANIPLKLYTLQFLLKRKCGEKKFLTPIVRQFSSDHSFAKVYSIEGFYDSNVAEVSKFIVKSTYKNKQPCFEF